MSVIKLNSSGQLLWSKIYGFNNYCGCRQIGVSCDGSIFLTGMRTVDEDFVHEYEAFLIKTDSAGNTLWCKLIRNSALGSLTDKAIEDAEGNYVINLSLLYNSGYTSFALLKIAPGGSILSSHRYYTPNQFNSFDLIKTQDQGFATAGSGGYPTIAGSVLYKFNDGLQLPLSDSSIELFVRDTTPSVMIEGNYVPINTVKTSFTLNQSDISRVDTMIGPVSFIPKYSADYSCDEPKDSIFIPNIFTPGSDGLNDAFEIKSTTFNNFHLSIYNRWGKNDF